VQESHTWVIRLWNLDMGQLSTQVFPSKILFAIQVLHTDYVVQFRQGYTQA